MYCRFFLYHLSSSVNSQGVMDLNASSPGREQEEGMVWGSGKRGEGGKPHTKMDLAAVRQKPRWLQI